MKTSFMTVSLLLLAFCARNEIPVSATFGVDGMDVRGGIL